MMVHLGYVATPLTLDNITYAHTMTYQTYQKLGNIEATKKLDEILRLNLNIFSKVLDYNHYNEIFFYRFSHNLVPLATHEKVDFDYLSPYRKKWREIGSKVKRYHIRMDSHPDQFCVINSTHSNVVNTSVKHLEFHYCLYQAMKIKGKVILHVGSSVPDKETAKKRFIKNFSHLRKELQEMILLENDDKIFNVQDVLDICKSIKIPMVLDYHHHLCNKNGELTATIIKEIFTTWKKEGLPPKVHFSSSKSKNAFRSHSEYLNETDFFSFLTLLKEVDQDVDIMLECKGRDMALFKLIRQLKCRKELHFLNGTTFIM